MRSRDVVGKRIVRVGQARASGNSGPYTHLEFLELEDGTRITFHVVETAQGSYYGIEASAKRKGGGS